MVDEGVSQLGQGLSVDCPVAALCGGCPWIGRSALAQAREKRLRLCRALEARGLAAQDVRWLSDGRLAAYRNRIRLKLDDGTPRFFNPHKLYDCAVLEPSLRTLLHEFTEVAPEIKTALSYCNHVELRAPDQDGLRAFCLFAKPSECDRVVAGIPFNLLHSCVGSCAPWPGEAARRDEARSVPTQRWLLTEQVFARVPITGFMQVNSGVNRLLVGLVRELCLGLRCRSFLDLFCGSGNLSLPLLAAGLTGAGIEVHAESIRALALAAQEQGLDAQGFIAADARDFLGWSQRFVPPAPGYDLVIVDPPRAGLGDLLPQVSRFAQRYLLMCSCNPQTLARDLGGLSPDFELRALWALDMFPQTEHVEGVALLARKGS